MAGEADVIVATNAFGMGIDKEDVVLCFTMTLPIRRTRLTRRLGAPGADGEPVEAILFFREQDIGAQAFHTAKGRVDAKRSFVRAEECLRSPQHPNFRYCDFPFFMKRSGSIHRAPPVCGSREDL